MARSERLLFVLEFCLLFGILYGVNEATFLYQEGREGRWFFDAYHQGARVILVVLVCQMCMYFNELYDRKLFYKRREIAIRLLQAMGVACMLLSAIYLLWRGSSIRQASFLIALPTMIVSLFLWRRLYLRMMSAGALAERVVILGDAEPVGSILAEIARGVESGFEVEAIFAESPSESVDLESALPVKNVFPMESFPEAVRTLTADRIVVAIKDRRGTMPFRTLLNSRFQGVQVEEAASFYERITGKILLDKLRPSWLIFSEGFHISKFTLRVKRILDITASSVLLLTTLPVMLLTALCIKVSSRGPVIYKQERVGQGWTDYTVYKFRSMVENAEAQGAKWAEACDPRITPLGRLIRKYRIDELPQLYNVLRGDMSFVGPRPERRCFVEDLAKEIPYYPYRLFVKPGITGWAQIKFKYGASRSDTMEKLRYDLYYIKNISFFLDISIMFDTVRVVLGGKGAR